MTLDEYVSYHLTPLVAFDATEEWELGVITPINKQEWAADCIIEDQDERKDLAGIRLGYRAGSKSNLSTTIEDPQVFEIRCKICDNDKDIGIRLADIIEHWEKHHRKDDHK